MLPLGTTSISTALLEMKHIHLLLVAFALSSGSLLAQTTVAVQGSLKKTTDRMPVDFANVLLRHPADSSLVWCKVLRRYEKPARRCRGAYFVRAWYVEP